ncbi:MAG: pyridoxine 5'-phosphate synthase [Myxococcota bacterium]
MAVDLHVNVDHIATLRQARGTAYPDPVAAALECEKAGAQGITVHLREDRRHIQDQDVERLREVLTTKLNLEMAATREMIHFALRIKPDKVTFVPEQREERTTEGGLDVVRHRVLLAEAIERLHGVGVLVSLFVDPEGEQVQAAAAVKTDEIELHTGDYADAQPTHTERELARLLVAARFAADEAPSLRIAAGHGLTAANLGPLVARSCEIRELNIGHAMISESVFRGLAPVVRTYLNAIEQAISARNTDRTKE